MKAIDVSASTPTLVEVLNLAGEDNIILRTSEGRRFLLAEIDEVAKVVKNPALMQLLDERSKETGRIPLSQVLTELQGNRPDDGVLHGQ